MATEVEPPELAALLDVAERPRVEDWSLRAAVTRYAQPQPERASSIIELVRRTEAALRPYAKQLSRDGAAVWAAAVGDQAPTGADALLIEMLRATAELDRLGDALAAWALERAGDRPDQLVDDVVDNVRSRLESLGVPREQRIRPPARR